jgi:predicted aldo/keto reductase-like oxidoreductase
MKTLGAGKLLSPAHTPFAKPMTVGQCIHYALTRPAVVSALIGCQSRAQVEEAVGYVNLTDAEKDYAAVVGGMRTDFKGNCVYCSHCQPCPAEIDIANVNKYLDIAVLDESRVPPSIAQHYGALAHHGSDCVSCGSCEQRCPFGVPVIKNMERAAKLFGK